MAANLHRKLTSIQRHRQAKELGQHNSFALRLTPEISGARVRWIELLGPNRCLTFNLHCNNMQDRTTHVLNEVWADWITPKRRANRWFGGKAS